MTNSTATPTPVQAATPTQAAPDRATSSATGHGQRLLITGVLTRDSIAWEVARQAQLAGAEVLLTGFGRTRRMTERSVKALPNPDVDVLELDVTSPDDHAALAAAVAERWDHVDGLLHAIAYAPGDAIGGGFLDTPFASASTAFQISAYSFQSLTAAMLPLLANAPRGGAVVGLDFDATVAWPSYDWMGVAKAALESVSRYLARDLGPHGVRVNLVAAGPISSVAAGGIDGFDDLKAEWTRQAPLGWDVEDSAPVAEAVRFLLSPAARAITGEILHVDGGVHAMGAAVVAK